MVVFCKLCIDTHSDKLISVHEGIESESTNGIFSYEKKYGTDFKSGEILPPKFRNLKKNLKRHKQRQLHQENLKDKNAEEQRSAREFLRQRSIGLVIGRTCYQIFKSGNPFTDFENLIYLQSINGADVGNINHSNEFPRAFMPYVADVVKNRVNEFIQTPLMQTGHQPMLNISADKATYKHRTRQFATATTIVPDSDQLLQVIFLGKKSS